MFKKELDGVWMILLVVIVGIVMLGINPVGCSSQSEKYQVGSKVAYQTPELRLKDSTWKASAITLPPHSDTCIPFYVFKDNAVGSLDDIERRVFKGRPLGFRFTLVCYTSKAANRYLDVNGFTPQAGYETWLGSASYSGYNCWNGTTYDNSTKIVFMIPSLGWFRIR